MENKKHPILKGILIGTAIVLVMLAIHFMRNYVIISQIVEKQSELQAKQNYYYVTEYNSYNERNVITEYYYKDGKSKTIVDGGENRKIIVWKDEEKAEEILLIPHAKQAIVSKNNYISEGRIANFFNESSTSLMLISFITNDIIDGKECYQINWAGIETYIDKSDGTVLRRVNGKMVSNGIEYDSVTNSRDWKFGELTDEDLARPDLTDYEVEYNEE